MFLKKTTKKHFLLKTFCWHSGAHDKQTNTNEPRAPTEN